MKIKPADKNGGVVVELGPQEEQLPSPAGEQRTPVMPVFKLKEILVPVDFSECTEKALLYAVSLAEQFDGTLTLLHVVESSYVPVSEMGVVMDVETPADAAQRMEDLRTRFCKKARCRTMVRSGGAGLEILDAAKEMASDLIILSTHGRSGLERLLMGSTVEKVVRHAGCPVLVVRPHEHDFVTESENDWQAESESPEVKVEATMISGL